MTNQITDVAKRIAARLEAKEREAKINAIKAEASLENLRELATQSSKNRSQYTPWSVNLGNGICEPVNYKFNRNLSLRENMTQYGAAQQVAFKAAQAEYQARQKAEETAKFIATLPQPRKVVEVPSIDHLVFDVDPSDIVEEEVVTLKDRIKGLYNKAKDYVVGQPAEVPNFQPWYSRYAKAVAAGLIALGSLSIFGDNVKQNSYKPVTTKPTLNQTIKVDEKNVEWEYTLPTVVIEPVEVVPETYKGKAPKRKASKLELKVFGKPTITNPLDQEWILDGVPSSDNYGKLTTGRQILEGRY